MLNFNPFGNPGVGNFPGGFPQIGVGASPFGVSPAAGPAGPAQVIALLQSVLSSLSQLAAGWSGALGNPYQQQPFPQFPPQPFPQPGPYNPGPFPQPGPYGGGFPQPFPQPGPYGGGFPQPFPQPGPYGGGFPQPFPQPGPYGGGGYPPVPIMVLPPNGQPPQTGGGGGPILPPFPTDPNDYASYLQAQRLGGSLQGKTGIAQRDAIPGTRFAQVQDPTAWNADVARQYAYQFAAYAVGADPLSPQGLAAGAQAMQRMSPDAQLFTQVASVFKGNLLGGPGNYNNPGLKQLLLSKGLGNLAGQPGVGETDVQTIGAITSALNSGQLSLQDVLNSGTIDNMDRYFNIINYVQTGGFANDVRFYDNVPLG